MNKQGTLRCGRWIIDCGASSSSNAETKRQKASIRSTVPLTSSTAPPSATLLKARNSPLSRCNCQKWSPTWTPSLVLPTRANRLTTRQVVSTVIGMGNRNRSPHPQPDLTNSALPMKGKAVSKPCTMWAADELPGLKLRVTEMIYFKVQRNALHLIRFRFR